MTAAAKATFATGPLLTQETAVAPLQALLDWVLQTTKNLPKNAGPSPDLVHEAQAALAKLNHNLPSLQDLFEEDGWAPCFNPLTSALGSAQSEAWRNEAISPRVTANFERQIDERVAELFASMARTQAEADRALETFRQMHGALVTRAVQAAQDDGCNHNDCVTERTERLDEELRGHIVAMARQLALS